MPTEDFGCPNFFGWEVLVFGFYVLEEWEFCLLTVTVAGCVAFIILCDGSIEDRTVETRLLMGCVLISALLPSRRLASYSFYCCW